MRPQQESQSGGERRKPREAMAKPNNTNNAVIQFAAAPPWLCLGWWAVHWPSVESIDSAFLNLYNSPCLHFQP